MIRKYYLSFTHTILIFILMGIPLFLALLAVSTTLKIEDRTFLIIFIILGVLITVLGKKIKITAFELSEHGLRINSLIWLSNMSAIPPTVKRFVGWDEIKGIIISYVFYGHQKSKIAKVFFNKPSGGLTYLVLNSSISENSEELFENLKSRIPNIMNNNEIFSDLFQNFISPSRIQYKESTLAEEGIIYPKRVIPWNRIKVIDYEDFNRRVSGYGTINITYQNQKDEIESIKIVPRGTEQFRNFLRYLIKKADKASIDPSLLKLLKSSYIKERLIIKLFVIPVVIISIIVVFFFGYFIYAVFFK